MKARTTRSVLLCLILIASLILPYGARTTVAGPTAEDYSHRYVLFLGGVNSSSVPRGEPINGDFSVIQAKLERQGFFKDHFIYFSYSAARFQARLENAYCNGWTPSSHHSSCEGGFFYGDGLLQGDLRDLASNPIYSPEDTKDLLIEQHSQALDWLIGQVVRVDPVAQVDLVGFSLGGIIASHWVAAYSDAPHRGNVRSLTLLNSPVGGFPLFNVIGDCRIELSCWTLRMSISSIFGENILRQLQLDIVDESIVGVLRMAPTTEPLIPITSIQSTEDYLVNNRSLPLIYPGLSPNEAVRCPGETLMSPVGEGTQSWPEHRLVQEELGGRVVTSPVCLPKVPDMLGSNHNAALRDREGENPAAARAAQFVLEAILTAGSPTPSEPPPPPPPDQSAILALPMSDGADGCKAVALPPTDDGSSAAVPLPFSLSFAGATYDALYVNNNGNVTFDAPLDVYVPFDLRRAHRAIIAPFFADVDTRSPGSGSVTYAGGAVSYDGRPAFCVNWTDVGYFAYGTDKRNSFQLLLIDRSDVAAGDFDIMFNYGQIQWDTADTTTQFPDAVSARAGYSSSAVYAFELSGSAVADAFLDGNASTGLIHSSLGATIPGRYVFQVRNGSVPTPVIPSTVVIPSVTPTVTATPLVTPSGPTSTPSSTPTTAPTTSSFWVP